MKKLSFLAVALFLSLTAFSQAEVSIGIKAGPNFAKINTEQSAGTNYKNRTGFHGGAFVLFKMTKIGIQPEILFSQQGSKVTFNSGDAEANYNYINVPILFKLYTVGGLNLQAGPQFGFLSGGEITQTIGGIKTTADAKEYVKGSDFSIALGLGWDLPFGLSVDGRYNLGISDINDAPSSSNEIKNQVWQLSVGYKLFRFGK